MPLILTPFRFHNFRLWTAANAVSVTGTWMQTLAASWLLLVATGSAAQMGMGVLAQALPTLLLGPWAGALADRLPARPLLTATQLLSAAVSAALGALAVAGGGLVVPIYAAMLLSGVVTAIEGPAFGRFGSLMVDRSHLGSALAVGSLTNSAGRILGMSSGGALIAATNPGLLFFLNAASFLVVIAVMFRLRPEAPGATEPATVPRQRGETPDAAGADAGTGGTGYPTSTWAGFRYLLRDPVVLTTLGLAFLLGSLGRNYQITMAAMSEGPLDGGAGGYGMLSTVFAVGTVAGGILAGRAGRFRFRDLALVGLGMSVLQLVSGLAPGLWWFAAALVPIAAAAVLVDTVVATRLQLDNPLALRGRVLGAVGVTGAIAGAVGAPVLGWLSDVIGPRGALGAAGTVAAVGCVVAAAAYAAALRRGVGAGAAPAPAPVRTPAPTPATGSA